MLPSAAWLRTMSSPPICRSSERAIRRPTTTPYASSSSSQAPSARRVEMALTPASAGTFTPCSDDTPAADTPAAASPPPTSRALARNPAASSAETSVSTSSMRV